MIKVRITLLVFAWAISLAGVRHLNAQSLGEERLPWLTLLVLLSLGSLGAYVKLLTAATEVGRAYRSRRPVPWLRQVEGFVLAVLLCFWTVQVAWFTFSPSFKVNVATSAVKS